MHLVENNHVSTFMHIHTGTVAGQLCGTVGANRARGVGVLKIERGNLYAPHDDYAI